LITSLPGPPPDLLVHEATDAYIPPQVDYKANRTAETVLEKCVERAHSTPVLWVVHPAETVSDLVAQGMAGEFAKKINAQRLVLNHIGSRYLEKVERYKLGSLTRFQFPGTVAYVLQRCPHQIQDPARDRQPGYHSLGQWSSRDRSDGLLPTRDTGTVYFASRGSRGTLGYDRYGPGDNRT
jgi:hypothetical protein